MANGWPTDGQRMANEWLTMDNSANECINGSNECVNDANGCSNGFG